MGPGEQIPNTGDIVVEYHPRSGRHSHTFTAEQYKQLLGDPPDPTEPPDDEPWLPFNSREDFEFAELVHDAALNRNQIEKLIQLIQRCQDTPGSFTFKKYDDLKESLEDASKLLTPVTTILLLVVNY